MNVPIIYVKVVTLKSDSFTQGIISLGIQIISEHFIFGRLAMWRFAY